MLSVCAQMGRVMTRGAGLDFPLDKQHPAGRVTIDRLNHELRWSSYDVACETHSRESLYPDSVFASIVWLMYGLYTVAVEM